MRKRKFNTAVSLIIIAISVASSSAICAILKNILQVPLPTATPYGFTVEAWSRVRSNTFSMPSGHASFATSLFVAILSEAKKYTSNIKILAISFIIMLSLSCVRIVALGFHNTVDVLLAIAIFSPYNIIFINFCSNFTRIKIAAIWTASMLFIAIQESPTLIEFYYGNIFCILAIFTPQLGAFIERCKKLGFIFAPFRFKS